MSATLELLDPPMASLSPLAVAAQVENGFPIATLDRLTRAIAPDDPSFANRLVPRATLARRRAQPDGRLTTEESSRLLRVYAVWEFAVNIWKDEAKARDWLFGPHMMLDDRRPIDVVIASEFGRPVVEGILGRMYYGIAI